MLHLNHRSRRKGAPGARLIMLAVSLLAAGCATTGPVTVRRDRFNFNDAGAESTKEQILLNIVRLRYGEPIYFVDIGSMLSHYTLSAGGHYSNYRSDLDVWNMVYVDLIKAREEGAEPAVRAAHHRCAARVQCCIR